MWMTSWKKPLARCGTAADSNSFHSPRSHGDTEKHVKAVCAIVLDFELRCYWTVTACFAKFQPHKAIAGHRLRISQDTHSGPENRRAAEEMKRSWNAPANSSIC